MSLREENVKLIGKMKKSLIQVAILNRDKGDDQQMTKEEIQLKIQFLRSNMIELGLKRGLNNEETIKVSQELDQYIFKYINL